MGGGGGGIAWLAFKQKLPIVYQYETIILYMEKLVHAHLIDSNMGEYRPLFRAFIDWLEANQTSYEGEPFCMHVTVSLRHKVDHYHYRYHQHEFREQMGGRCTSVTAYLSDPPNCNNAERASYCLTLYLEEDGSNVL